MRPLFEMDESTSQIQQFFQDQTVFITGSTGLLGKVLLWKLLHSCCGIKKVYLLLREKKGQSPEQRFDSLFANPIFQSLKDVNFKSKVELIIGDCALPGLGISDFERDILVDEVTCIFHISATIKFDEHIRTAAFINVRAVMDLLNLAKKMKNLKSFEYISTAYSNCNQKGEIKEKFYEAPMNAENLLQIVNSLDVKVLDQILPKILGDWPNTYTFTKAIAESVIREKGEGLPVAVMRPSIVMSCCKEPQPGFLDTFQGITALCVASYAGIFHCQRGIPTNITSIVPLDYVVNNFLSAAWHLTVNPTKMPIYNFTGHPKSKFTWGDLGRIGKVTSRNYPTVLSFWWVFIFFIGNKTLFQFSRFWLHVVPTNIFDFFLFFTGKRPKLVKILEKIEKGSSLVEHFVLNSWIFENTNTQKMWDSMNEKDKSLFMFNMETFDWQQFMDDSCTYSRVNMLKDPMDTLPKAKRRMLFLGILHYGLIFGLVYLCYAFLCVIFNLFHK